MAMRCVTLLPPNGALVPIEGLRVPPDGRMRGQGWRRAWR
jgi:hypothetical protein